MREREGEERDSRGNRIEPNRRKRPEKNKQKIHRTMKKKDKIKIRTDKRKGKHGLVRKEQINETRE